MIVTKKTRMLFIGDSITRGGLGVNYVKKIQAHFGGFEAVNKGVDGESLNLIMHRLVQHLKQKNNYDFVVCAGGLNDATIRSFLEKGPLFRFAYKFQIYKGNRPIFDGHDFEIFYEKKLQEAQQLTKATFILLTLNCANEKSDTKYNKTRIIYNEIIRKIAKRNNCLLADAALGIDKYLASKTQRDFLFKNFWTVTYTDPLITITNRGADWLSKIRKLHVTIDGVHLNSTGADIFAQSVIAAIEHNQAGES